MTRVRIAIVGSGPAGLSAACRAAEAGDTHILLEAQPHLSNTIYRYQKGKHVMAEPGVLPLRAAARFEAGKREAILTAWDEDVKQRGVNMRLSCEVTGIKKMDGHFAVTVAGGEVIEADSVVLGIGMQGNIRKLGAPGEDLERVQYQLDDPDEYKDETIVVVGAGDAAIENAIALSGHNQVVIVNRRGEFARAKEANSAAILAAIAENRITCYYNAGVEKVEARSSGKPLVLRLNSKDGNVEIACDRIIGRLGATPPREFVEACGITFPSKDPNAIPAVSARYESNVPGLYVVGALAGYPLIKQALNQGYEVVEMIQGRPVAPADEPILKEKFAVFSGVQDVEVVLDVLRGRMNWVSALTTLQLREFLLESTIHAPKEGQVLYEKDDYSNSVYAVLAGEVKVRLDPRDPSKDRTIKAGRIFGEMALVSGRRRTATLIAGKGCTLIEIPRRAMIKLINSHDTVRQYVDRVFALRALQTYLAPEADEAMLKDVLATASLKQFKAQDPIYKEGDPSEEIHLIRSGSVMLSMRDRDRDVVLAYVAAGQYFGELDVIAATKRQQSARAAIKTETIAVKADAFMKLLDANPDLREAVRSRFRERVDQRLLMERAPERGAMMKFLLQEGLGEATDALLIDEALCVRCDQCEKACAATHGNVSRLDREAGATYENLHVPTSCRHCEHPHCMKDCPPDAIHRAPNGEVYIEDTCIGCGNCERNCPYGVIHMGVQTHRQPSLWRWMLTGGGMVPGSESHDYPKDSIKKAVKCDMCRDRAEGPACVQACPTGAAIRVGPEDFFKVLAREGR